MAILSSITVGELSVHAVDADPSISGFASTFGSLSVLYTGAASGLWLKNGAGNTAWSVIIDAQAAQTISGVKTFSVAPIFSTAPTFSSLTATRIPFAGAAGLLSDSANLIWDNTNSALTAGPIGATLTNNPISGNGNVNSFVQLNVQNLNAGTTASSDLIATADNGTDTSNFIDLGIQSSASADATFTIAGALDGYLYASNGNVAIGTASAKDIKFFTNGTLTANQRMVITSGGLVGIGGTPTTYPLEVTGKLSSTTGYILGSDMSLLPIIGNQSAITAYWGLQLVGNRQANVDYTPTATGGNNIASVLIPNQQAAAIGLLIRGQTSQSGNLLEIQNVGGTLLTSVLSTGLINAPNAIRLGTTADTTNGNVRYGGLDIEFYRDTWRNLSYPKHTFDDFYWTAVATSQPFAWASTVLNGGANTFNATNGNSFSGIVTMSTGTTANATGVAALQSGNGTNSVVAGSRSISVEWRIRAPVVSTTPFFEIRVGLQDTATLGDPTNGIYFSYIDSGVASAWQCVTRNAATSTTNTSGVNVVAGTWYRLRIEINAAGTSVGFYIDSGSGFTLVNTNTTNITVNPLRLVAKINKITSSATARTADLDFVMLNVER
jgi:hypothetical protein